MNITTPIISMATVFTAPIVTLALLCITSAACSPHAQHNTPQTQSPERRLYVLQHRLHLSEKQTNAIRPIITEYLNKTSELMKGGPKRDNSIQQELEHQRMLTTQAVSAYLTDDQIVLYHQLLEEESIHMSMQSSRPHPSGGRGKPRQ